MTNIIVLTMFYVLSLHHNQNRKEMETIEKLKSELEFSIRELQSANPDSDNAVNLSGKVEELRCKIDAMEDNS